MVAEIRDRESDIPEKPARLPQPGFHILTRAMADRSPLEGGGKLFSAPLQMAGTARVALRWHIGQFFRILKHQGLHLADSQRENAGRLIKLTAIAARAACTLRQRVQARDG